MKKIMPLSIILISLLSMAAVGKKSSFYEHYKGTYALKKGNLKQCSDGEFAKTSKADENSYLLGSAILFSNIDGAEISDPDPENESCNFKTKSKQIKNGFEQTTKTFCLGKLKSTHVEKIIGLPTGELKYAAPEGECIYAKEAKHE